MKRFEIRIQENEVLLQELSPGLLKRAGKIAKKRRKAGYKEINYVLDRTHRDIAKAGGIQNILVNNTKRLGQIAQRNERYLGRKGSFAPTVDKHARQEYKFKDYARRKKIVNKAKKTFGNFDVF